MAQEFLDGPDIIAIFQQMGRKRMPQGMTAAAFLEAGLTDSVLHRFLEHAMRHMVSTFDASAGINRTFCRGKDVLPFPGGACVGIFAGESIRQVHLAVSGGEVFLMEQLHPGQMPLEWCVQGLGQHGNPVLPAFAVAHGELVIGTIHILDSEPHALHQAQPGAREQTRHEGGHVTELGEHRVGFLTGKDRGETLRALRAFHIVQVWKRLFEDVPVQKQEGMQGAVLGGGGDLLVECQVDEKGADLRGSHVCGVALLVQEEKPFDPTERGDCRAIAPMPEPQDQSYLVE